MALTTIYYLHRGDDIPFYIGKTTNIGNRLSHHKKNFGIDVDLEVINEVKDWKFWESYYIKEYQDKGYKLENKNAGGGGPGFASFETKDKIRKSKLGTKLSQETKDKISKVTKGKPKHTPKSKESLRKSRLGTKVSQETKNKIYTEERNNKISKANKNRNISHEWREKMSLAKKGKPSSASKPVIQYNLKGEYIKEWSSIAEAKRWLGSGSIQSNVLGRQKSAGGYIWKFK